MNKPFRAKEYAAEQPQNLGCTCGSHEFKLRSDGSVVCAACNASGVMRWGFLNPVGDGK